MKKNTPLLASALCTLLLLLAGCAPHAQIKSISGNALGTFYNIKYVSGGYEITPSALDSLFERINSSVSLYRDNSILSRINAGDTSATADEIFAGVFAVSKEVHRGSNGWFDPTVLPLVEAYGFMEGIPAHIPDKKELDSLMALTGFEKVSLDGTGRIVKPSPGVRLDFNAIAKGYAVDMTGRFLESLGTEDYLVEIGGEIRCRGVKPDGTPWLVGIEDPLLSSSSRIQNAVMEMRDMSVATSGNYRKYRTDSTGRRTVHTINPRCGLASPSDVLSATVTAPDCATADGYATAMVSAGYAASLGILENHPELGAFLVYTDTEGHTHTYVSHGLKSVLKEIKK